MVNAVIRNTVTKLNVTRRCYEAARAWYHRLRKLYFFAGDIFTVARDMHWSGASEKRYWAASAELLFQYHKLEKGLCMPGPQRFFGYDPATATLQLLAAWRAKGLATNDPVYRGAVEALYAYRQRIEDAPAEKTALLKNKLDQELAQHARHTELSTPIPASSINDTQALEYFSALVHARRSQRCFSTKPVALSLIQNAINLAQLSPSACNRQPNKVHVYSDRGKIDGLLTLQNGNRGFGHTIPTLLILSAESSCFFDASERHEPYIDGGLFAMSLLFALQAQGLSSCCLNWCVEPAQDTQAHQLGQIPASEKIIMYLAVGYADENSKVPRSPRRALGDILITH